MKVKIALKVDLQILNKTKIKIYITSNVYIAGNRVVFENIKICCKSKLFHAFKFRIANLIVY